MKFLSLIYGAVGDLVIRYLPAPKVKDKYCFAFLVHPRNTEDVYRKFPFLTLIAKTVDNSMGGVLG